MINRVIYGYIGLHRARDCTSGKGKLRITASLENNDNVVVYVV